MSRSQTTVVSRWLVMPMAATGPSSSSTTWAEGGGDGLPDLLGVVLDPAGPGEVLRELPVGHGDRAALLVDGQGPHPGRAGIDGDDRGHAEHRSVERSPPRPSRRADGAT